MSIKIILPGLFSVLFILEFVSTSYLIYNNNSIKNVLKQESFQNICYADKINTFDNGILYHNTLAFLILLCILFSTIIISYIVNNKLGNNRLEYTRLEYNRLEYTRLEQCIYIFLIIILIGIVIINITQLIFQLYNISFNCIELINNSVSGFTSIYSILGCCCCLMLILVIFTSVII
jgi:hypothetical protein